MQTLHEHLAQEHKISPVSHYLREIVYGGNDGIVTTFAVVAGFTGATGSGQPGLSVLAVLLFGVANLFADGAAMGLGNFLSIRSNQDVYREQKRKELTEMRRNKASEEAETREILMSKGYSEKDAAEMTKLYAKNEAYWLEFMMNQELELPNPENERPVYTGIATFVSFALFGSMPLLPYIFLRQDAIPFSYSIMTTITGLVLLGLLRWNVTKENLFRSVGEVMFIGGISAMIAYGVGTFFR